MRKGKKGKGKAKGQGKGKGKFERVRLPSGAEQNNEPRQLHLNYLPPDEVDQARAVDPALRNMTRISHIRSRFNFSTNN